MFLKIFQNFPSTLNPHCIYEGLLLLFETAFQEISIMGTFGREVPLQVSLQHNWRLPFIHILKRRVKRIVQIPQAEVVLYLEWIISFFVIFRKFGSKRIT